jgi:predicted MFS family arabinose efflux permease
MAFGGLAGVFADRVERRKLLIVLNIIDLSFPLLYGTLLITGNIQFWHLAIFTFLGGVMWTSQGPTRQVYTVDLVGETDLANAAAVNLLGMRLSTILGSSLIGTLMYWIGIGPFFYFLGALYVVALILLLMIRVEASPRASIDQKSVLRDLIDGLKYIGNNKPILGLQLIALVSNIFAIPCDFTLVPIFAYNILKVDAAGFAWLMTASGIGIFVFATVIAIFSDFKHKGLLLALSSIIEGIIWIIYPSSTLYHLSVGYYVLATIMRSTYMMMINILLLSNSSPDMRGRVMGVRSLVVFPLFGGNLIAGLMTEAIGLSTTFLIEGALSSLFMLATIITIPKMRKLE